MDKDILEAVALEQREEMEHKPTFVPRQMDSAYLKTNKIVAISGVRRCGKSTLLRQISQNLDGFYYFNFEDERLLDFTARDFNLLFEVLQSLYGEQHTFLFDEIQEIAGWEKFVSRLYRLGYKVYVTGSNAKLLSSELSTLLTGRHLVWKLYPFSFAEYLQFHKVSIKPAYTTKERAVISRHFRDYIRLGGFPEVVVSKDPNELEQLYQDILIKDLLVRYQIRSVKSFRELALFYLSNIGSKVSFNNLKTLLGFKSTDTVKRFTEYLESAYMFFLVNKYDYSLKKQYINDKKVYCIDTGLAHNLSFRFSENTGRYLENIVFIELMRRRQEVFYFSKSGECDFITRKGTKITTAIQVTQRLTKQNYEREVNGLIEAMRMFNLQNGLILTYGEEEKLSQDGMEISVLPIWKWLLEPYVAAWYDGGGKIH